MNLHLRNPGGITLPFHRGSIDIQNVLYFRMIRNLSRFKRNFTEVCVSPTHFSHIQTNTQTLSMKRLTKKVKFHSATLAVVCFQSSEAIDSRTGAPVVARRQRLGISIDAALQFARKSKRSSIISKGKASTRPTVTFNRSISTLTLHHH